MNANSNPVHDILPSLSVELQKIRRSKTLWVTALASSMTALIGGFFMFILKDPERARNLGLIGAKAQIFGGSADWPNFFNLMLLMVSIASIIIFGFIFVWVFGREFSEKTIYDMLALPTSRLTIVMAKIIIAALWCMALILLVYALMLGIGLILRLPGWSITIALSGFRLMLVTGLLSVLLSIPFALVDSVSRGYLPAVACMFLALILGQIVSQLGYGQYFPWTIPMFYSGAIEALTGKTASPIGFVSYAVVIVVGVASIVSMAHGGATPIKPSA